MPNNTYLFKCKLFHSYYESLFMSMHDKQTKCCGCVTSHSQQIGQPPCLALTDLWTSKQSLKYFTSGNKNGSVLFLTRKCIWNQPSLKFSSVFITHNKVTSIAPSYLSLNRRGFYYDLKQGKLTINRVSRVTVTRCPWCSVSFASSP